jgi:hypothetical protein
MPQSGVHDAAHDEGEADGRGEDEQPRPAAHERVDLGDAWIGGIVEDRYLLPDRRLADCPGHGPHLLRVLLRTADRAGATRQEQPRLTGTTMKRCRCG